MPRRAIIRTILATMIGLTIWLPAVSANAADPCCRVSVSGLSSHFTAGADPQQFGTSLTYTAANGQRIQSITAVFTFAGSNLSGSQVQLARMRDGRWRSIGVGRHDGALTATDNFTIDGRDQNNNGSIAAQYRLSFGARVQSQSIQMLLTVTGRVNDGHHSTQQQLGQSGPFPISITGAGAPTPTTAPAPVVKPTPTPTPTPTAAAAPSGVAAPTVAGAAPGSTLGSDAAGSGGGSSIWIAYMIGGLLLIGGIGVIGTILWKRGGHATPAEWDDPYAPVPQSFGTPTYAEPGYTAPAYGAPTPTTYGPPPTTAMPTSGMPTSGMPTTAMPTTGMPTQAPPRHGYTGQPPLDPTRQMPRQ